MSSSKGDEPNPLLEAALEYAKRGWPVFPLKPRSKVPIPWNGFKAATTDERKIRMWWLMTPDANIGLPTGIGFDVLDPDGEEGIAAIDAYAPHWKHTGPVVNTGRGWHMYLRPTGRGNGAGLIPHVDFRGRGGYVVAPPSVHPSGSLYAWDRGGTLVAAPDWLLTLLDKAKHDRLWDTSGTAPEGNPDIYEVAMRFGNHITFKGERAVMQCVLKKHNDTNPSFTLYLKKDNFYCFGCETFGWAKDLEQWATDNGY